MATFSPNQTIDSVVYNALQHLTASQHLTAYNTILNQVDLSNHYIIQSFWETIQHSFQILETVIIDLSEQVQILRPSTSQSVQNLRDIVSDSLQFKSRHKKQKMLVIQLKRLQILIWYGLSIGYNINEITCYHRLQRPDVGPNLRLTSTGSYQVSNVINNFTKSLIVSNRLVIFVITLLVLIRSILLLSLMRWISYVIAVRASSSLSVQIIQLSTLVFIGQNHILTIYIVFFPHVPSTLAYVVNGLK